MSIAQSKRYVRRLGEGLNFIKNLNGLWVLGLHLTEVRKILTSIRYIRCSLFFFKQKDVTL